MDTSALRALVQGSGISYSQNRKSWILNCPRCQGQDKLYIRKTDGRFICWKCVDFKGAAEYALAEVLGLSLSQVQRQLYGQAGAQVRVELACRLRDWYGDGDDVDEEAVVLESQPQVWPLDYYPITDPKAAKGLEYARSRGIPAWLAERYGLRYAPEERRLIFPIENGGQLYGWQGRLVVPHQYLDENGDTKEVPKITTSFGTNKGMYLMFSDTVDKDHAVLCEGPVDAIKASACGGAVATMGKSWSRRQIEILLLAGIKRLYVALDPDAADEIRRLVQTYFGDVELYEMLAPASAKDLGAMDMADVYDLFLAAPRIGPGRIFSYLRPPV